MLKLTQKQEESLAAMVDNKYTLLYGGSRSGKSFIILVYIVIRALKKRSRHAILRYRFSHVKQSIAYDTLPKVLELMDVKYKINKSEWFFTLPNGSEIWLSGLDEKDRVDKILGNEYSTIFFNEASQISYDAYTTVLTRLAEKSGLKNKILIDENPPSKAHWTHKLFFQKLNPDTNGELNNPGNYFQMKMSVVDNKDNIDNEYIVDVLETLTGRKRKRFYDGDFSEEDSEALFSQKVINATRINTGEYPELKEIIVAIDPAITAKITSDETGIIVVGKGIDNRGYVLADKSNIYKPKEWGTIACALYTKYRATYLVAESNQGGDMVEHTINTINMNIPVKMVHASKGKLLRAEPISSLYEKGRISHVGVYPDLEEEMITYTGVPGEASPNRLDALVWALTFLFPIEINREIVFEWT
jgi:phage terminase large subunit-like protein